MQGTSFMSHHCSWQVTELFGVTWCPLTPTQALLTKSYIDLSKRGKLRIYLQEITESSLVLKQKPVRAVVCALNAVQRTK